MLRSLTFKTLLHHSASRRWYRPRSNLCCQKCPQPRCLFRRSIHFLSFSHPKFPLFYLFSLFLLLLSELTKWRRKGDFDVLMGLLLRLVLKSRTLSPTLIGAWIMLEMFVMLIVKFYFILFLKKKKELFFNLLSK